jgi:hypothetical protein
MSVPATPVPGFASPPPRVITGSSDGKLRVWEGGQFLGYINVPQTSHKSHDDDVVIDEPAHKDRIQVISIDERSRYIVSHIT